MPAGVRAVLAVAVRLGGSPVGSLTVYRDVAYEWDESDEEAIRAHADVLEGLLGTAVAARRSDVAAWSSSRRRSSGAWSSSGRSAR